ncbi:MAG: saccharopine dehydrogenase NADP-binding domain-containing protein, partial [Kangiellaceae bacterium]|nr:saccharopine dehydrogenase NADP-binding domain-containing protein [Kangiellaceae bacterium]
MKILVIGGYGNFGKRLVKSLLQYSDHEIIIAGRSIDQAEETVRLLKTEFGKTVSITRLDVLSTELNKAIIAQDPDIVVNASGPYHFQLGRERDEQLNYRLARACLSAQCHYIDLADNRDFVSHFADSLDTQAKQLGLTLVTGASTVPSLPDAVIQHFLPQFSDLTSINYGISPGNRTERGRATVASILSYTGKTFTTLKNGRFKSVYGWQDLSRYDFGGPIGTRWMSNCDIPDLELLPAKYPSLKSVKFQAGLEVSILHLGLWFLSFFTRISLLKNWSRYASLLTNMSEWFSSLGSDSGGMFIELAGQDLDGSPKIIKWQLVAEDGVGPNVPIISALILIQKIAENKLNSGAQPCMGLFNLDEFFEVRVASVLQMVNIDSNACSSDGLTPHEQLEQIAIKSHELVNDQYHVLNEILIPELAKENIQFVRRDKWTDLQRKWLNKFFNEELLPILTPVGLDSAHPFPRILNKSLNFIISLTGKDAFGRNSGRAILQVPRALPRIIQLPVDETQSGHYDFVFLSSIIHAFVNELFNGMTVKGCHQFRVTRNSDFFGDEDFGLNGNVLVDNGNGADFDPENDFITV